MIFKYFEIRTKDSILIAGYSEEKVNAIETHKHGHKAWKITA